MKYAGILVLVMICYTTALSQDDLMELLEDKPVKEEVNAIFKGTRLVMGHSVKMRAKKELEFLITHRFGRLNEGAYEFFGLDNARIRLALEYGIWDNLNVGIGRSSFDKTIDGFIKYRIINQSTGPGGFPVAVVLFNSFTVKTFPKEEDAPGITFNDRLANVHQLLVARKVNSNLSLQVMPTFVHKNSVEIPGDDEDQFLLGIGGRMKITKGWTFNTEYYYRFDPNDAVGYTNDFSVGFDIETGGHVFQLHLTNSIKTVERAFLTETPDNFFDGDIHFGFNISRTFQLGERSASW